MTKNAIVHDLFGQPSNRQDIKGKLLSDLGIYVTGTPSRPLMKALVQLQLTYM